MEWYWKEDVKKSLAQIEQEEKIIKFYTSLGYEKSLIQWCLESSLFIREAIILAIPNNKKRMLGLPLTRIARQGRAKKRYKQTIINYAINTLLWGSAQNEIARLSDMYLSYLNTGEKGEIE